MRSSVACPDRVAHAGYVRVVTPHMPAQRPSHAGAEPARLPAWASVLAVVAHPDDESFGLGAILDAFSTNASSVSVLCLTHGEASTLHDVPGDLAAVRDAEFAAAARILGVTRAILRDFADGALDQVCRSQLAGEVIDAAQATHADGLLVFDLSGVTGHPDHTSASTAAVFAATVLNLPVLGWTVPIAVADALNREFATTFAGHAPQAIDISVPVNRTRQIAASSAHVSQAIPSSVLWRRLELLGDHEHLRWLHHTDAAADGPAD